ncbi:MAG: hypothetical protein PHO00_07575 [bacterium]|nr:hypothetical protein [bacterium]
MKKIAIYFLSILAAAFLALFIFIRVFPERAVSLGDKIKPLAGLIGEIEKTINKQRCPECGGAGRVLSEETEPCPMCKGGGYIKSGFKDSGLMHKCPKCAGNGVEKKTVWKTCSSCDGKGYIER